jgi:hypothetical protein
MPARRAPGVARHLAAAEFGAGVFFDPGRPAAGGGPVAMHDRQCRQPRPAARRRGLVRRQYGREPDGVWFAPGRVNLMGGPDYTETFVLPVTLGAGVCASRRLAAATAGISLVSRQADTEPIEL